MSASIDGNPFPMKPKILSAVQRGQLARVKEIVKADPDAIRARYPLLGDEPVHVAAVNGRFKILAWLIEQGADINARDVSGKTPLYHCVQSLAVNAVNEVLRHGADLNIPDHTGFSPLATAVFQLNEVGDQIARLLLDAGCEVDLHAAVALGNREAVRRLTTTCGLQHLSDYDGAFLMTWALYGLVQRLEAIESQDDATRCRSTEVEAVTEILTMLVNAGINVNSPGYSGGTALHVAVERPILGREIVVCLLGLGADSRARSNTGQTPLDIARRSGNDELVQLLMSE